MPSTDVTGGCAITMMRQGFFKTLLIFVSTKKERMKENKTNKQPEKQGITLTKTPPKWNVFKISDSFMYKMKSRKPIGWSSTQFWGAQFKFLSPSYH